MKLYLDKEVNEKNNVKDRYAGKIPLKQCLQSSQSPCDHRKCANYSKIN